MLHMGMCEIFSVSIIVLVRKYNRLVNTLYAPNNHTILESAYDQEESDLYVLLKQQHPMGACDT